MRKPTRWVVLIVLVLAATAMSVVPRLLERRDQAFDEESQRLLELLALTPSDVVADVGAGKGAWSLEMARRVGPSGKVFATEIDPERIQEIHRAVKESGMTNIAVLEAAPDDTKLPPGCCDAIFLRHVYHHITHPEEMGESLRQALRPDGRLAVIDFNPPTRLLAIPGGVRENRRGHGMPIEVLIEEMSVGGFEVVHRIDDWFRLDYCVVFERRDLAPEASVASTHTTYNAHAGGGVHP
jgi:ubiquinone/menaquinone biosynthesis C-methylase UbiE